MEEVISHKWQSKESRVAMLISDKINFKSKIFTRNTEGHYLTIKESIHQENITIVNMHLMLEHLNT